MESEVCAMESVRYHYESEACAAYFIVISSERRYVNWSTYTNTNIQVATPSMI